jgi:hypothetical protein
MIHVINVSFLTHVFTNFIKFDVDINERLESTQKAPPKPEIAQMSTNEPE